MSIRECRIFRTFANKTITRDDVGVEGVRTVKLQLPPSTRVVSMLGGLTIDCIVTAISLFFDTLFSCSFTL
jgi:hypothetical protein